MNENENLKCAPLKLQVLLDYAVELARPSCCEVVLGRFLTLVRIHAKTEEDVTTLFREFRNGKNKQAKTIRSIKLD